MGGCRLHKLPLQLVFDVTDTGYMNEWSVEPYTLPYNDHMERDVGIFLTGETVGEIALFVRDNDGVSIRFQSAWWNTHMFDLPEWFVVV